MQPLDLDCPDCGLLHDPRACCHCGEDRHDDGFCCLCGHFHDGDNCPAAPCGDYRCCTS